MELYITTNYEEMSDVTSSFLADFINQRKTITLGLATGSTPERTYEMLMDKYKSNKVSFSGVTTFNLDEYIGIDSNNKQSYRYYMNNKFFNHIDIDKENTFVPQGVGDMAKEIREYEMLITNRGPIDIQLLGLGANAHIGFNEPGSPEDGGVSEVDLTKETIESNKRFFDSYDEVPKKAISMGIGTIMKAKQILLIASGEAKAKAVRDFVEGPVNVNIPASYLQNHPSVIVIVDLDAAKLLKKEYRKIRLANRRLTDSDITFN